MSNHGGLPYGREGKGREGKGRENVRPSKHHVVQLADARDARQAHDEMMPLRAIEATS